MNESQQIILCTMLHYEQPQPHTGKQMYLRLTLLGHVPVAMTTLLTVARLAQWNRIQLNIGRCRDK